MPVQCIGVLPFIPSFIGLLQMRLLFLHHIAQTSNLIPILDAAIVSILKTNDVWW